MARTDTAILDFDGVIADSMPQHLEAYRKVLEPFGVHVRRSDVYLREGARSESIIRTLLGDRKEAQDPDEIKRLANEKQRIFAQLGDVELYPKADGFVRRIRQAADRLGLVTGTRKVNLERWAGHLMPLFDTLMTSESYTNDKPHPEPYAKAIASLGKDPGACVVVENAPRGVTSAKAAGAGMVIAIATTLPAQELEAAGPHVVASDHDEALSLVLEALS